MGDGDQTTATRPTREDLDAKAESLGIENPGDFKNMELLEDAIREAEDEPRYTREEVLANARTLTGYSATHMAGAIHDSERERFTKEQAKRAGDAFARRKVKG